MPTQILLVDGDPLIGRSLAEQLGGRGFVVHQAMTADAARQSLAEGVGELVLIDAGLADADAAELCADCRARGFSGPILVLGGEGPSLARHLQAGATDGLAKPYRIATLVTRVESLLRALPGSIPLRIGSFDFHPLNRMMTDGAGRRIRLTEKEAAILSYLHRAARVVPRDELLGEVWGYSGMVSTHTLETHIYRLRRKLSDGNDLLVTQPGGYRLAF
jgi:DNA-binding response OmpR family regulator